MNDVRSLINNQNLYKGYNPFIEDIALPPSALQIQAIEEAESKYSQGSFQFKNLPNVLRYLATSFFSSSELVKLSCTCKSYKNVLVAKNGQLSPYVIEQLRNIKVMNPSNLNNFKRMSQIVNASIILRECQNLIHLIVNGGNEYKEKGEIDLEIEEIKKSIENCPNLQYLSMSGFYPSQSITLIKLKSWKGLSFDKNNGAIYNEELTAIAQCFELTHLKFKYKQHNHNLKLMDALRNLKKLTFLEIPREVSLGGFWHDPLNYQEVKELINRHVYIQLVGVSVEWPYYE